MLQDYEVWVVIDPESKDWFKVKAESLQNAAEMAALDYDQRSDVDFALSKEGTVVQILVRDPATSGRAYTFDVSCTLNPYYEITGAGSSSTVPV